MSKVLLQKLEVLKNDHRIYLAGYSPVIQETIETLQRLMKRDAEYAHLESLGVDNWEGFQLPSDEDDDE